MLSSISRAAYSPWIVRTCGCTRRHKSADVADLRDHKGGQAGAAGLIKSADIVGDIQHPEDDINFFVNRLLCRGLASLLISRCQNKWHTPLASWRMTG
jgi:hypothetical protein